MRQMGISDVRTRCSVTRCRQHDPRWRWESRLCGAWVGAHLPNGDPPGSQRRWLRKRRQEHTSFPICNPSCRPDAGTKFAGPRTRPTTLCLLGTACVALLPARHETRDWGDTARSRVVRICASSSRGIPPCLCRNFLFISLLPGLEIPHHRMIFGGLWQKRFKAPYELCRGDCERWSRSMPPADPL